MINALVVDDERMVRQGLQSLTNWNDYGLSFVGEARDGLQALQLLSRKLVDVMFVDITMPNMNGFELMKHVQERHPDVKFVILTCHHEFDYVQEALQLGAIDYIVKTLLNRDNVDETAKRIMSRLKREIDRKQEVLPLFSGASYLYHAAEQAVSAWSDQHVRKGSLKLIEGQWFRYEEGTEKNQDVEPLEFLLEEGIYIVQLSGSKQLTTEQIEAWLVRNGTRLLFYAGKRGTSLSLTDEQLMSWMEKLSTVDQKKQLAFIQETEQYRWLIYPQAWKSWCDQILGLYPEPGLLQQLCQHFEGQVLRTIQAYEPDDLLLERLDISNWASIEGWLRQFSLMLRGRMGDLSFSQEVMLCMIKVIQLMHKQISLELNQNELAHQVGMSRSYFSQCFKRFYGISFSDVLRQLRIDAAKRKLVTTQLSISDIANQVGFVDHKYFSRTFRAQVGQYPTEYRSLYHELR